MALDGLLVFTVSLGAGIKKLVVIVRKGTSDVDVLHGEGDLVEYVVEFLLGGASQGAGQGEHDRGRPWWRRCPTPV